VRAVKPRSTPPKTHLDPEMAKLRAAIVAVPNTCEGQLRAGVFAHISEIKNRRLLVVDEQKGSAAGFPNFYHDSNLKTMKIKGVPELDSMPSCQGTFNLPAMHFPKIKKGKICDIEATGLFLPYGTKTGWEWAREETIIMKHSKMTKQIRRQIVNRRLFV